jgi:sodium-dependent dicarboxylate transporter 2/3/5
LSENKGLLLLLGPIVAVITYVACMSLGLSHEAAATAGVTIWCLLWWVSEAVPIPVTSMLPMGLLPLLGVLDGLQVAQAYGSPLILVLPCLWWACLGPVAAKD